MASPNLPAGFSAPVWDAQAVFRAILDAQSRPGRIVRLAALREPVPGLCPAVAAALLTLADYETPIWLDPHAQAAADWLLFHTGAPLVTDASQAAFAVIQGDVKTAMLGDFDWGDDRYPDRSTTVFVCCPALDGGEGLTCRGPGILATGTIAPTGLRAGFWQEWHQNTQAFPRGVDLILASGADLFCLPRTIRVEAAVAGRR